MPAMGRKSGEPRCLFSTRAPHLARRLDGIFLHPVFGILIFVAVVLAVFQRLYRSRSPYGRRQVAL